MRLSTAPRVHHHGSAPERRADHGGRLLSVIIPAWNEASLLPGTLASLHQAVREAGLAAEVIVVDNASTDGTAGIAACHGVRLVHEPVRGIARARNAGARAARGDVLVFLDADTRVTARHLLAVRNAVDAGWAGGGAPLALSDCRYRMVGAGVVLWNILARCFGLAAGCFVFTPRELHNAVGGFDERLYAGEEIGYSRRLARIARRERRRFGIIDAPPVESSGRKTHWFSPWQHVLVLLIFLLFPLAARFRRLTWFWYRRPGGAADRSA